MLLIFPVGLLSKHSLIYGKDSITCFLYFFFNVFEGGNWKIKEIKGEEVVCAGKEEKKGSQ